MSPRLDPYVRPDTAYGHNPEQIAWEQGYKAGKASRDAELRAAIKGLSEASPAGYHRTVDVHAILALLDQPVVPKP